MKIDGLQKVALYLNPPTTSCRLKVAQAVLSKTEDIQLCKTAELINVQTEHWRADAKEKIKNLYQLGLPSVRPTVLQSTKETVDMQDMLTALTNDSDDSSDSFGESDLRGRSTTATQPSRSVIETEMDNYDNNLTEGDWNQCNNEIL